MTTRDGALASAGRDNGRLTTAEPTVVGSTAAAPRATAAASARASLARAALPVWDLAWCTALVVTVGGLDTDHSGSWWGGPANLTAALPLLLVASVVPGLAVAGAYDHRRRQDESRLVSAGRLALVAALVSWGAMVVASLEGWAFDARQMLVVTGGLPVGWALGRWTLDRRLAGTRQRVLLVGSGAVAERLVALLQRRCGRRFEPVGRVGDEADADGDARDLPLRGGVSELIAIVSADRVERVIVCFAPERDSQLLGTLRECVERGVQVDVVPRFFDLVGPETRTYSLGGLPVLPIRPRGLSSAQRAGKRAFDLVGASLLLVLFAPLALVVAVAIATTAGRPLLFRQTRVGRGGRTFPLLKFRTMAPAADGAGVAAVVARADEDGGSTADVGPIAGLVRTLKLDCDRRVTPIGRVLRSTSLDELPQLVNVLRGDMSLVGPRPLRPFEVGALCDWQRARLDLRPGLTGLWQVLGRSNVDWAERMQLDYVYVAHWSFVSDLRILLATPRAVAWREGAL